MAIVTMMCGSLLVIRSSPLHKRNAAAWVLDDATVNVVVGVLVVDVVMVMVMVVDVVVSAIFAAWRSRGM
jgi:hypothetical protein